MCDDEAIRRDNALFVASTDASLPTHDDDDSDYAHMVQHFCGQVIRTVDALAAHCEAAAARARPNVVYLTGNVANLVGRVRSAERTLYAVVVEYASNYAWLLADDAYRSRLVRVGRVPLNVHNAGVFFRAFFEYGNRGDGDGDGREVDDRRNDYYFGAIAAAHEFQALTESNKGGTALRKGIYLSNVTAIGGGIGVAGDNDDAGNGLQFNLLRCSSNLRGPTDNFRDIDRAVLRDVNEAVALLFERPVELNHVLAQIYYNGRGDGDGSVTDASGTGGSGAGAQRKASIKSHADKTKDMPRDALIAFASFYDFGVLPADVARHVAQSPSGGDTADTFDWRYRGKTSVLTQLEFVLKNPADHPTLVPKFRITLYPNSLFLLPLCSNRLYRHEVKPSTLPADHIPLRMGYTMRCSARKAVHVNGTTYIVDNDGTRVPLRAASDEDVAAIKELYRQENVSDAAIAYPPIYCSLNDGDYMAPML